MNPTLEQPDEIPTETTLASLLHASMVDFDLLDDRYHALLQLVDAVLGVVPNCDRYLEIWPPAFRTYNIMVPNLLNLPVPVFGVGGPTPTVIGLAMYVASRTAECPYCSAHSCSFAMRRGAAPAVVAAALLPERACFSRGELAAIAVARSLARVPSELTQGEKAELIAVYGERNAEWIVLSVVMMGFLNKFMDAIGVELEQGVADEVSATMGPDWSPGNAGADLDLNTPQRSAPPVDGLRTKLRLLPLLPGAVRYDRQAQRGVPSKAPAVGAFLTKHVGHDFPILAELHSNRARRAIASMLRENLDPTTSAVGMETKALAGTIFATVVDDESLAGDIAALASHAGVAPERLRACAAFARGQRTHPPAASAPGEAALVLALAASSSPARIDGSTVDALRAQGLSPEAIVEVITWLAVLQMMHRLTCYTSVEGLKNVTTEESDMTERKSHDAVSIDIAASPDQVYELVSDITRMGEWSPECYQCAWSKGATGPAKGARFKAKNKGRRGPSWGNSPVVTAAEPGKQFAFNRSGPGIGSYTWRYVMEPTPTGTRLTESFDAERPLGSAMTWLTMKWTGSADRDADLREGMLTTLSRIKAAAESA